VCTALDLRVGSRAQLGRLSAHLGYSVAQLVQQLAADSGKGQEARSGQPKPVWSDEEVEKLMALSPTHSASAIASQPGRGFNAVRGKAQKLGMKKAAPPTVTSPREAKPAPKPPLSAAVISDSALVPNDFSAVSLLDHHPGQCCWIINF
jgi:hypothetical protein